jgi:hypothetical protein
MYLEWMTTLQTAEAWGITVRQVQSKCQQGQVKSALHLGRVWLIPKSTPKPIDGRTKIAREIKKHKP